jgi:sialic acid synthase SpsE
MKNFEIAGRKVGYECKPLVIAEIGINHEGSLETAFAMVDAAASAGAEIIKHQTHIPEDEMSAAAKKIKPGNADVSIFEVIKRCALTEQQEIELKRYVESKGVIFISTPFSLGAVHRLEKMKVPAFKIGSGEFNNLPLIRKICAFGKPIILSTGMNDMSSVRRTVALLEEEKVPFALMHTTNLYPTPPKLVRLGAVSELIREFPNVPIGLSDHTTSNYACFGAVALGASLLERHFTDKMDRPGPDIVCSMDSNALRQLIEGTNILAEARGGGKTSIPEEQVTRDFAFATVVVTKQIRKGELLDEGNLWVKRPGTGEIQASELNGLFGRIATRDISVDEHLCWADIQ